MMGKRLPSTPLYTRLFVTAGAVNALNTALPMRDADKVRIAEKVRPKLLIDDIILDQFVTYVIKYGLVHIGTF